MVLFQTLPSPHRPREKQTCQVKITLFLARFYHFLSLFCFVDLDLSDSFPLRIELHCNSSDRPLFFVIISQAIEIRWQVLLFHSARITLSKHCSHSHSGLSQQYQINWKQLTQLGGLFRGNSSILGWVTTFGVKLWLFGQYVIQE